MQDTHAQDRIEKQIQLASPLARVWQALTDSQQFGEWFKVKLEGPFVAGQSVGGNITWHGYEHLRMDVVVTAIEPQSYFAFTWHPYAVDPAGDYSHETQTLVEFHLEPNPQGTLLKVVESGFASLPAARRDKAFLMNTTGWQQQLVNIEAYVARPA